MKKLFKITTLIALTAVIITSIGLLIYNLRPFDIKSKAVELEAYCKDRGYNTDYGILVDYGRHSFQQRLYVYDFNKKEVIMKSLSGHGSGGNSTIFKPDFSNDHGSHCSSLGHYRIGKHRHMYNRPAVPAVEVHGLDKTNSNALSRGILIHPSVGPLSWGCVTLPLCRYLHLSELLDSLPQNVIMWIYE